MRRSPKITRKTDILNAATASFLKDGYGASNIDDIAKRAGVSKPTVYKHYDSKFDLFCQMIYKMVNGPNEEGLYLAHAKKLEPKEGLTYIAGKMVNKFYREDLILLYRLIISESSNFPEMNEALAQCFCNSCHENMNALLTHYAQKGLLKIEDPEIATNQFIVLLEVPVIFRLFMRRDNLPDTVERQEIIERTVDMFWHYYKN